MKPITLIVAIFFSLSLCNLSERLHGSKSSSTGSPSSSSSSGSSGGAVEKGEPTAAQTAALAGGQPAKWDRQGMSWTVPAGWSEQENESKSFHWRSPGGGDAASLIVSISPYPDSFPADSANDAAYEQAKDRAKAGEVDEVKWVEIDGVKGVQFREATQEHADAPRRLQWLSYRKYLGQVQGINIMLATDSKDFERHKNALYGILYSTKITH
jgi:hypothetical protein